LRCRSSVVVIIVIATIVSAMIALEPFVVRGPSKQVEQGRVQVVVVVPQMEVGKEVHGVRAFRPEDIRRDSSENCVGCKSCESLP